MKALGNDLTLERALFTVRARGIVSFGDEQGAMRFYELLRPHIRSDERVRALLLNRVMGGVDSRWLEPSCELTRVLDLLLDELPDSEQVRFLLNYIVFQTRGEDGHITLAAHRVMERRFPNDPWFRRHIEQIGGGWSMGLHTEDYPEGFTNYDKRILCKWAESDTRYIPMCLALGTPWEALCRHPGFDYAGYDLPTAVRELLESDAWKGDYWSRVRSVLTSEIDSDSLRLLAANPSPENTAAIIRVAENEKNSYRGYARTLLAGLMNRSREAMDWARKYKPSPGEERWWTEIQARWAEDHAIALDAARKYLGSDLKETDYSVADILRRFCFGPWRLNADEGFALFKSVLEQESFRPLKGGILMLLAEAYPDHPETRALLFSHGAAQALYKLEGLTSDVVNLALQQARRFETSDFAILRDSQSDEAFECLIQVAKASPHDLQRGAALSALVEAYREKPEVKALLHETALSSNDSRPRCTALCALAWNFKDDPQTADTLMAVAQGNPCYSLPDNLFSYISDPDYSGWLRNRELLRASCASALANRRDKARDRAAFTLALWFGHESETMEQIIGVASDRTDSMGITCLEIAAMRWPGHPRVFAAAKAALSHSNKDVKHRAARLLSRAFATHPETAALLKVYIEDDLTVFGEYIGLRMGDPQAMADGLAAIERASERNNALASEGPLHLFRYFGPRKDLRRELLAIAERTSNRDLQDSIRRLIT